MKKSDLRDKIIIHTSLIGIATNLFLVIIKSIIGFLSGSIAIILDAINNLTDVISSVVTIIGTFLASKKPDAEHPMGHGRIEYISAIVVAIIIIYAGITAAIESIAKFLHPTETIYTIYTIIVLVITIIVKFFLGAFVKSRGEKYDSPALIGSGIDATNDCFVSATVLISTIIYMTLHIQLDAIIGLFIAFCITKAGFGLLIEDIGDILGKRMDREFTSSISELVKRDNDVIDVHDLVLHNYGPNRYMGSIVCDVDSNMTAEAIDSMTHRIKSLVLDEKNVILTGIGICSINTEHNDMRENIVHILEHIDHILQVHGIHINTDKKVIDLDVIISFDDKHPDDTLSHARMHLKEIYPEYTFNICKDSDI